MDSFKNTIINQQNLSESRLRNVVEMTVTPVIILMLIGIINEFNAIYSLLK